MRTKHSILAIVSIVIMSGPSMAAQASGETIHPHRISNFSSHVSSPQHLAQRCTNKIPVGKVTQHKQSEMMAGQWVKGQLVKHSRSPHTPFTTSVPAFEPDKAWALYPRSMKPETNARTWFFAQHRTRWSY
jgi:hypothetical protein